MQEYCLTIEERNKIQRIQLEMLEEVDRICRKCDIQYNIIAGTLLGAVRHQGVIPWDDDADVALLREEYNKFREVCKTELDTEKYYFQDHTNTPGYRWGYGKLRRKNSLFLRKNQEHMPYEQGIFIDIFPLDSVPQNRLVRKIHNSHCFIVRKIMWSAIGRTYETNTLKRMVYKWLFHIDEKKLFAHYEKLINKSNAGQSEWVRILTYPTPTKDYGYLKKWYEKSTRMEFDGSILMGIAEWDEYLRFKFGDYMQLPAENERKTHPITMLRLPGEA
jgi:lipopolysaccharide cholinephosphotransferase